MLRRVLFRNRSLWNNKLLSLSTLQRMTRRTYVVRMDKEPFQPIPNKYPKECNNPTEAVSAIKSNDRIFIHGMCATPELLINALCVHADHNNLSNIELVHLLTSGPAPQISQRYHKHFTDSSLFTSTNVRNAVNSGIADYVPIFLSEIPLLFVSPNYTINASILHVSPPDSSGFCSLGCNVDIARAAAAGSEINIGLINKFMPRAHGDGHIHISQFEYIYESHQPLPILADAKESETESELNAYKKIGQIISEELVNDGDCIQAGIGKIPQFIFNGLYSHKNLGLHSEMFGDQLVDLYEAGVITNSKKKQHAGKCVASFVVGTNKVFDFIDDNPAIVMCETNYVNDTTVIASNPNVTAINSALEMDLSGQVVSDSIGLNIYSGVGGQVDFIRGASLSDGGKPILCMTSTTRNGKSKIVPTLTDGSGVVCTRAHVQYVVTEYGMVNLFGKNLKERAEAMISIAHPSHREWLYNEAQNRFKNNWNPDIKF